MDEITTEFLAESYENLARLDLDLVELEKNPRSVELLSSVFRTFHTMKGVAGFLNFSRLEALAHAAEDLLSSLREGGLTLDAEITSALLAGVDAVRQMLAAVESSGTEGQIEYGGIADALRAFLSARAECAGGHEPEQSAGEAADESGALIAVADSNDAASVRKFRTGTEEGFDASAAQDPAAAVGERPSGTASSSSTSDSTIRVKVHLLDKLMNLAGELVLVRNQVQQCAHDVEETKFLGASQRLNLITAELQAGIMKTRMQPISAVWSKFPRVVRDLARACGKQVRLEMTGENTELDRTLIEAIRDPLTHIVRNAIDHGIESPRARAAAGKPVAGSLSLRAFHENGQVIIEVAEDGAGLDLERVRATAAERGLVSVEAAARMSDAEATRLIFLPGFSTAEQVTNISGRGVGMDVVRRSIEKIGGAIEVHSRRGEGVRLRIRIPLTLAIIPALIVTCAGDRYAIAQVNLIELVRVEKGEGATRLEWIHGAPVLRLRGNLLPLIDLCRVLRIDRGAAAGSERAVTHIVVLQAGDQQVGLIVDEIIDAEEIVVKRLGAQLTGLRVFAGATIMGDGQVALILDALGLAQQAGLAAGSRRSAVPEDRQAAVSPEDRRRRLLLCRAGAAQRIAIPLTLVSRLEEFERVAIERAAGRPVVGYRGRILPLVDPGELLGAPDLVAESERLKVLVFDDGRRRAGLVVDEVIDIVEEEAVGVWLRGNSGLIGSALVGGKIADFLDVQALFARDGEEWSERASTAGINHAAVLLVDDSAFTRGMVRSYLELAGHRVYEARRGGEALQQLDRLVIDIALISTNLPGDRAEHDQVRARTRELGIALVGLADERAELSSANAALYDAYHFKSERQSILETVARLSARTGGESRSRFETSRAVA